MFRGVLRILDDRTVRFVSEDGYEPFTLGFIVHSKRFGWLEADLVFHEMSFDFMKPDRLCFGRCKRDMTGFEQTKPIEDQGGIARDEEGEGRNDDGHEGIQGI